MNIRQLRYISAVAKHGLNVSATAELLYTSQPGVSKQIRLLEEELGIQIFERSGRQLTKITPEGTAIIELADRALIELESIKRASRELSNPKQGHLTIGASHTQARYALPPVLSAFAAHFPEVTIALRQGTPFQIAKMLADGEIDFAIATESLEHFDDVLMLPCYHWHRALLVRPEHQLAEFAASTSITLEDLAQYSLVTYEFGFSAGSPLQIAFEQANLTPQIALSASDAEVIKTYVRAGFGVGILARMAIEPERDQDLVCIEASDLFDPSTVKIGFRRGTYLRSYMFDFIARFAPHLDRDLIATALEQNSRKAVDALFMDTDLPIR